MKLEQFIENFSEQFDETEFEVFTPETKFKDLEEWSSLIALSVIAMIDEEYDVSVKGDDIRNTETILDLYELVKSK